MLEALLIVRETMDVTHIKVHAQNITSEANSVADKLSQGRSGEALIEASKYFGFEASLVSASVEVENLLTRLARVAYRAAEKAIPNEFLTRCWSNYVPANDAHD